MKPVLYGTIVVGMLDAIDAIVIFGLRGSTPIRVFQGIASGWLGRASFGGGLPTGADEAEGGDGAAALLVGDDTAGSPVIAEYLGKHYGTVPRGQ